VAKVARDAMMRALDERYPGYELATNVGYASARHLEALRQLGPSPVHRQSFRGAQRLLF
jgi:ribonuclease HII